MHFVQVVLLTLVVGACGQETGPVPTDPPPTPGPTPGPTTPAPTPPAPTPPSPAPPTPGPTTPTTGAIPPTPASCANAQRVVRPPTDASRLLDALNASPTEPSREQLTATLGQIDALLARNANDADAHYVRGVLLRALESPPADILAAYARALELDPRHADAAYNSGVVEGRRGDHAAALTWFQRSAAIDPTHGDAQYNIGQSAYNLGRFQEALDGFLCARALSPEPFDETKKVVQALHALGRFADAAAARQEMWRLHAASSDPRVRQMDQAVIDQMRIEGREVMISETVTPAAPPDLRYIYIVRAYENGRQVQQCQLESSAVATQMGTAALVGFQRGNTHHTTRTGFAQMPSYEQARPVLVDLMGRLLRGENVESGASSTPR